jgi:hypothetical protein
MSASVEETAQPGYEGPPETLEYERRELAWRTVHPDWSRTLWPGYTGRAGTFNEMFRIKSLKDPDVWITGFPIPGFLDALDEACVTGVCGVDHGRPVT